MKVDFASLTLRTPGATPTRKQHGGRNRLASNDWPRLSQRARSLLGRANDVKNPLGGAPKKSWLRAYRLFMTQPSSEATEISRQPSTYNERDGSGHHEENPNTESWGRIAVVFSQTSSSTGCCNKGSPTQIPL